MLRTVALLTGLAACGETVDTEARRQIAELREVDTEARRQVAELREIVDAIGKADAARDATKWWCDEGDSGDLDSGRCFESKALCDADRTFWANQGFPKRRDCYHQDGAVCVTNDHGKYAEKTCGASAHSCEVWRRVVVRNATATDMVSACDWTR